MRAETESETGREKSKKCKTRKEFGPKHLEIGYEHCRLGSMNAILNLIEPTRQLKCLMKKDGDNDMDFWNKKTLTSF